MSKIDGLPGSVINLNKVCTQENTATCFKMFVVEEN